MKQERNWEPNNGMGYLTWSERYSVSVPEMDEQHKKLIDLVNAMYEAMQSGRGHELIGATISEFADYTDYHFKAEERLLQQSGYPEYGEHREMHEHISEKARNLKKSFEEGQQPSTIEVMILLTNWLNLHILEEDRKYKPFVSKAGHE